MKETLEGGINHTDSCSRMIIFMSEQVRLFRSCDNYPHKINIMYRMEFVHMIKVNSQYHYIQVSNVP